MKKIIYLTLILISIGNAHAANIISPGKITQLHFWEGINGVLIIHENMINPEGCARSDQYVLRQEHPFFKELYSLLLSAHLSGQPVRLGLQGCYQNFPSIVHIYSNK